MKYRKVTRLFLFFLTLFCAFSSENNVKKTQVHEERLIPGIYPEQNHSPFVNTGIASRTDLVSLDGK